MASTNTLKTRIQLKIDSLTNWQNSTFKPLKGEVCIAQVDTVAGSTLQPVMIKVGDGEKTFAQLDWLSAKAADVYGWAKAADVVLNGEALEFKDTEGTVIKSVDLSGLVNPEDLAEALGAYYTKEETDALLEDKVDKVEGKSLVDDTLIEKLGNMNVDGEANIIETVKVNGVALTPDADKAVDVTVPTTAQIEEIAATKINTLIGAADDEGGETIQNIANLVDYVEKNGGQIAQLVTDVKTANDNASSAVTTAGEAKDIADNALEVANGAATDAEAALEAATNAQTGAAASAEAAAESARLAGEAKTAAETAKQGAVDAQGLAEDARDEAVSAKEAAEGFATAAEGSATAAGTSAYNAEVAAGTATTKASEAATSAANALTSEGIATTKAGEATQAAADAATAKGAAETAQGAAEEAQTKAEEAQAAAEAAKTAAENANAGAIATANEAKEIAEGAATTAGEAKETADAAKEAVDGLHAIAKTGNVDDLVQTEGTYLVFDCGSATTVID